MADAGDKHTRQTHVTDTSDRWSLYYRQRCVYLFDQLLTLDTGFHGGCGQLLSLDSGRHCSGGVSDRLQVCTN